MVGVLRPFALHSFSGEGSNLNVNFADLSPENFAMCANVKVATRAREFEAKKITSPCSLFSVTFYQRESRLNDVIFCM